MLWNGEMEWNENGRNRGQRVVGVMQIYSEKKASTVKVLTFVIIPVHAVLLYINVNLRQSRAVNMHLW